MQNMYIRKTVAVAAALTIAAPAAYAASFQTELEAEFQSEKEAGITTKATSLLATYYLAPVDTSAGPIAEAAFLNPTSNVAVGVESTRDDTTTERDLAARFQYADKSSPVTAGILIARSSSSPDVVSRSTWMVDGAYYVNRTTTVGAEFTKWKSDYPTYSVTTTFTGINARFLNTAANYAIKGDYTRYSVDSGYKGSDLAVAFDYYLDNMTSVGAGLINSTCDISLYEGREVSLNAKKFVTETVAVALGYAKFSASNATGDDTKTWNVDVIARF